MIIPLSDEIRIRGTGECWQLERSKAVKGQVKWAPCKYFSDLGQAVSAAVRREIRLHPANTLAEAIEAVDQIAARYSKLLDDALESRRAA